MVLLPTLPPIHCPVSTAGLTISAVQCLNVLAFAIEKQTPTGYSKFADKATAKIPSQTGMLIIYVPAMVTAASMLATAHQVNGREALVAGMTLVHFAKRVFEVLCVHKYSGNMGPMCYFIGTFYALLTLLITVQTQNVPPSLYAAAASQAALPIAIGLFALGELGNLYHHALLAAMRKGTGAQATTEAKAYSVPQGGLFPLVATPHYLFEIVAWLGISLAAQQLNALLVTAGMASYLSGRAVASTQWYRARFGEAYPASRKHLVPFLF